MTYSERLSRLTKQTLASAQKAGTPITWRLAKERARWTLQTQGHYPYRANELTQKELLKMMHADIERTKAAKALLPQQSPVSIQEAVQAWADSDPRSEDEYCPCPPGTHPSPTGNTHVVDGPSDARAIAAAILARSGR